MFSGEIEYGCGRNLYNDLVDMANKGKPIEVAVDLPDHLHLTREGYILNNFGITEVHVGNGEYREVDPCVHGSIVDRLYSWQGPVIYDVMEYLRVVNCVIYHTLKNYGYEIVNGEIMEVPDATLSPLVDKLQIYLAKPMTINDYNLYKLADGTEELAKAKRVVRLHNGVRAPDDVTEEQLADLQVSEVLTLFAPLLDDTRQINTIIKTFSNNQCRIAPSFLHILEGSKSILKEERVFHLATGKHANTYSPHDILRHNCTNRIVYDFYGGYRFLHAFVAKYLSKNLTTAGQYVSDLRIIRNLIVSATDHLSIRLFKFCINVSKYVEVDSSHRVAVMVCEMVKNGRLSIELNHIMLYQATGATLAGAYDALNFILVRDVMNARNCAKGGYYPKLKQ